MWFFFGFFCGVKEKGKKTPAVGNGAEARLLARRNLFAELSIRSSTGRIALHPWCILRLTPRPSPGGSHGSLFAQTGPGLGGRRRLAGEPLPPAAKLG